MTSALLVAEKRAPDTRKAAGPSRPGSAELAGPGRPVPQRRGFRGSARSWASGAAPLPEPSRRFQRRGPGTAEGAPGRPQGSLA